MGYLAFPILHQVSDAEYLISYKRGYRHARDRESVWEMIRFDPRTSVVSSREIVAREPGVIFENGEWVQYGNGVLDLFLDRQSSGTADRQGLEIVRSTDGGANFAKIGLFPEIEGVQYGYCFASHTEENTTWLLVMNFEYLAGGTRTVHAIRSDDYGESWRFVKNLSNEFGDIAINECGLLPRGDQFLVVSRGYDDCARLHITDGEFNTIRQSNITQKYDFMKKYISRPRPFERDGRVYLLGRNYTTEHPGELSEWPMQLCFYRLDPDSLEVIHHAVMDNADLEPVTDGYYATPYWQNRGNEITFNVITYKGRMSHHPKNQDLEEDPHQPSIVRLEYRWDDIR